MIPDDDLDGELGPPDVAAMERVRSELLSLDGLMDDARTGFDSLVDASELYVVFEDGIGDAEWARFDVTWYRDGYYRFHHVDSEDVNFRWDYHPKEGASDRHFHEPPDAPSRDPAVSCITTDEPALVARAVHKLWRRAYAEGSLDELNTATNPP